MAKVVAAGGAAFIWTYGQIMQYEVPAKVEELIDDQYKDCVKKLEPFACLVKPLSPWSQWL